MISTDQAAAEEGSAWAQAIDDVELLDAVERRRQRVISRRGVDTVFVGSALTNFGVRHVLDTLVDLAPAAGERLDVHESPRALDSGCSAFVFKVQANMDKSHRDRIAFVRVCSGKFERGMVLTCHRTGKPFATKYASQVFVQSEAQLMRRFPVMSSVRECHRSSDRGLVIRWRSGRVSGDTKVCS